MRKNAARLTLRNFQKSSGVSIPSPSSGTPAPPPPGGVAAPVVFLGGGVAPAPPAAVRGSAAVWVLPVAAGNSPFKGFARMDSPQLSLLRASGRLGLGGPCTWAEISGPRYSAHSSYSSKEPEWGAGAFAASHCGEHADPHALLSRRASLKRHYVELPAAHRHFGKEVPKLGGSARLRIEPGVPFICARSAKGSSHGLVGPEFSPVDTS